MLKRYFLMLSLLVTFGLVFVGCASTSVRPQSGKCVFWDNLESQSDKATAWCFKKHPKDISYGVLKVICRRAYPHKGKHHFHYGGECLWIWK